MRRLATAIARETAAAQIVVGAPRARLREKTGSTGVGLPFWVAVVCGTVLLIGLALALGRTVLRYPGSRVLAKVRRAVRAAARLGAPGGLRLYRRLLLEARPYWRHVAALFALSLLSSVFALLTPLPLAIAVDSIVGNRPPGFVPVRGQTGVLLFAGGLFLLISLLKQLQEFARLLLSTYTGENLLLRFRSRLFRHAERVSLRYHDSKGTADSTYRIQYDATAVQNVAVTGLIPFFTATLTVAGMVYVTARIDWLLALVSLAVTPALFLAMTLYRKRLRAQWHDAKRLESSAMSVVQESLEALRVVKAFGREDDHRDRFADRSAASVRAKVSLASVEGRFGILVGAVVGLGMATILFLGARRVVAGAMTLGELTLVMGYLQQLYDPLKTASKKLGSLQSSLASAERAYSLLDEEPDFVDPPDALPLERAVGSVAFRNVSFAYDQDHRVLEEVSFDVPAGATLGIAGTTGAGKTTLVSLLTRFYDPSNGEILLDGVDLRRYRLADLRDQFAIVLQEPVLFSTSVAANIAYARPGADDRDVVAAAEAASAHDFIIGLPDGYETLVGERGVRLSGGERQRIALARAFLKDAPILILDEPTSSVDMRTEAEILEAMERLMRGRTAFMIAHRRSTLAICDSLLEVEHGRIVGRTSPAAPVQRRVAGTGTPITVAEARRPRKKRIPVPCDPVDHPVVGAWRTIAPRRRVGRVERLRARPKAEVYRLQLANGRRSVIAKRGRSEALLVERTIYESVLPRLPSPALGYLGFVDDDNTGFSWLFIEDGGEDRCSLEQHGSLAARWLGTLHGAALELDLPPCLPKLGPDHYLEHLRAGRATILGNFDNRGLASDDRDMLRRLVSTSELIESSWGCVEAACSTLPRTLVHGDIAARNLRLRRDQAEAGPAVVAFDWEHSGFGIPATDVYALAAKATRRDLSCYRKTLSEHASGFGEGDLAALLLVGTGFRLLASVDWATTHLPYPRPEKGIAYLHVYERPLREWVEALAAA